MTHVNNFINSSFSLDESDVCRNIILWYLMHCKIPIFRLSCGVFDVLKRVRCTSWVCNPHIIAFINQSKSQRFLRLIKEPSTTLIEDSMLELDWLFRISIFINCIRIQGTICGKFSRQSVGCQNVSIISQYFIFLTCIATLYCHFTDWHETLLWKFIHSYQRCQISE